MYYISRRIGTNKYGVVDTTDGTEDIMDYLELQEAVIDLGIQVEGVETFLRNKRTGARAIQSIHVVQNSDSISSAQAKLHVLKGINVKTSGSEIVSISWEDKPYVKEAVLRLSDWGTSCANYLFSDLGYYYYGNGETWLTIILDDKCKLSNKSFKRCGSYGLVMDLREVSDDRQAEYVYREIIGEHHIGATTLSRFIIDKKERLDFWKGVTVIHRGARSNETFTHISQVVDDWQRVNDLITKKFSRDFLSISDCKFAVSQRGKSYGSHTLKPYVALLAKPENRWWRTTNSCPHLKSKVMTQLFRVLRSISTCNEKVLLRFENYMTFFDSSPQVNNAFVKFCLRANNWIYELGRQVGWVA